MKNYKKVIALLTAASMTLGLAACGGTGNGTENGDDKNSQKDNSENSQGGSDTEGENSEDTYDPYTIQINPATGEKWDLGGMEIIIRDWWSSGEPVDESTLSGYQKAQYKWRKWAQETYNFTIKEQAISGWGDVFTDLEAYATTGGDENNYIFTMRFAGELISQMNAGLYYDLSTITSVDFNADKWDPTVKEFGTVNGKTYAMRRMSHEPRTGVYFNKRILRENGYDPQEIYTLQANREWTWDKFEEYVQALTKDTNNDGVMDQYGFLEGNSLRGSAIASNGGNLVGRDENGKYYLEAESENTLEALTWAQHMIDDYNYPNPDETGENWAYFWDVFKSGGAAFMVQQEYAAGQDLSDMEDEFGFVAFPMGPKETSYVDLMQDNIHVLPACYDADKANKLVFAYSLYYAPVPDYEDYSDYYAGAVSAFKDMDAPEQTLGYMSEKTVIMYHSFIPGINDGDLYWSINAETTPAARMEELRDSWQAYIDAANGES